MVMCLRFKSVKDWDDFACTQFDCSSVDKAKHTDTHTHTHTHIDRHC